MARKNKSKKEIVSDIQLTQDAERRRALVRDVIFPFLVKENESIEYSKLFLQSFSGIVNGVYEESRKKTTITHLQEPISTKIKSIFNMKDEKQRKEFERYTKFADALKDISIQDLSYGLELSRYIDGFIMSKAGKESIKTVDIDKILG